MKGVYASCDFHVGSQATWPPLATLLHRIPLLGRAYRRAFTHVAATVVRFTGGAELAAFPRFADEQLSHATYVHLDDGPCTEHTVLEALREGRTCVTRGTAELSQFDPVPGCARVLPSPVRLRLSLPVSYSVPRPRSVIVCRDGEIVHWEPYAIPARGIDFTDVEPRALPGVHAYQVDIPSKFLSSPIVAGG